MGLARLLAREGDHAEAHHNGRICDWFIEGFHTAVINIGDVRVINI